MRVRLVCYRDILHKLMGADNRNPILLFEFCLMFLVKFQQIIIMGYKIGSPATDGRGNDLVVINVSNKIDGDRDGRVNQGGQKREYLIPTFWMDEFLEMSIRLQSNLTKFCFAYFSLF